MYQAELVKSKILADFSLVEVELVKIKTGGDMVRKRGKTPFETKRIYTREIEDALLRHDIDLAVHSAKDMAVHLPEGLCIGAVIEREDPRDCLVSKDKKRFSELPLGSRIGTSSLRRKAQLLRRNPDLIVEDVHGNVDTRIRKLEDGEFDAVVLAYAGIKRLGLVNYIAEIFSEDKFYPAPGQGTIVVESSTKNESIEEMLRAIHHDESADRLECERAFLRRLEGGCQLPCGITTKIEGGSLKAAGALFATEGRDWVEDKHVGSSREPAEAGKALANVILDKGGREILARIRETMRKKKVEKK